MGNTTTSVGPGPASGGNENHDGDPTHTTLGEAAGQEAPAGQDAASRADGEPPADGTAVPGPPGE